MTVSDLELGTICYIADVTNQQYQKYLVAGKSSEGVLLYPCGTLGPYEDLSENGFLISGVSIQDIQSLVTDTKNKIKKPNRWDSDILDKLLDMI